MGDFERACSQLAADVDVLRAQANATYLSKIRPDSPTSEIVELAGKAFEEINTSRRRLRTPLWNVSTSDSNSFDLDIWYIAHVIKNKNCRAFEGAIVRQIASELARRILLYIWQLQREELVRSLGERGGLAYSRRDADPFDLHRQQLEIDCRRLKDLETRIRDFELSRGFLVTDEPHGAIGAERPSRWPTGSQGPC